MDRTHAVAAPDNRAGASSVSSGSRDWTHVLLRARRGPTLASTPPGAPLEESFCDTFAEELLIPDAALLRERLTASLIFAIAGDFGVSLEVAARAVARRHPERPNLTLFYWSDSPIDADRATLQWSNAAPTARPVVSNAPSPASEFDASRRQLVVIG